MSHNPMHNALGMSKKLTYSDNFFSDNAGLSHTVRIIFTTLNLLQGVPYHRGWVASLGDSFMDQAHPPSTFKGISLNTISEDHILLD